MGDDSESWEDEDIYFWVAEKSEQVLVEDGIAASSRVEEGCIKVSVG